MITKTIIRISLITAMMLPSVIFAKKDQPSMNKVDTTIAQVVGKENVGTTKKVIKNIAIAAIVLPTTWFIARCLLKPWLKHQYKIETTEQLEKSEFIEVKAAIVRNGIKNTTSKSVEVPASCFKSICQKVFWIQKYQKDGKAVPGNWKKI